MLDRSLVSPTQLQNRAREEAAIRRRGNRSLTVALRIERRTAQTRYKTPGHGATGRHPLTEGPFRRYSVGVLSGSKAGKRVYLDTI